MENTTLIGAEFKECDLTNATLKHTLFKDCICEDSKFIKTNFLSAKLINCTFKNCDCKNADFQNSKMNSVRFNKSDLENASFINSTLTDLILDKTITDNIDFTDISLNVEEDSNTDCKNDYDTDIKSTKADIDNTVQENSNTSCKSDSDTDVKSIKADIYNAVLNHALFRNINMSDTNFQFTTGVNTRFETAGIKNANFKHSKLKDTIFKNTNLTGIQLGNKHFEQIYSKEDVSETIDIAEFVNKDDAPIQPKTSNQADSQSPITTLQADVEKLMQDIIDDLGSVSENDDEALLKVYSKQITKMKDVINRIKNDDRLANDIKDTTLDFVSDMAAIFEYRKIELASKLSIELTLKEGIHKPNDCTDKIKPSNVFTDEYYGFYISPLTAEHMVKAYKNIHGTNKLTDWSVADIMVNCLDITEVNFTTYTAILINFINDLERCECDGFIIKATKDKPPIINKDKLIKICKTHYGFYLPDDFDYKNNLVLFRGRYLV